jgi:hypothetical protein
MKSNTTSHPSTRLERPPYEIENAERILKSITKPQSTPKTQCTIKTYKGLLPKCPLWNHLHTAMSNDGISQIDKILRSRPYSVVIGRQRVFRDSVGNRRLQVLAMMSLPKYAQAKTKAEKSKIVNSLVTMVHEAGGSFFKEVDGTWSHADIHAARAKVGVVLRDSLHDKYRSSTKSKVEARRQRQDERRKDDEMIAQLPYAEISSVLLMEVVKSSTWDPSHTTSWSPDMLNELW